MIDASFLEKAVRLGASAIEPVLKDGLYPYTIIPQGFEVKKLEEKKVRPDRLIQTIKVFDADSFVKYFTDFCDEDSRVLVDQSTAPAIIGILDYHQMSIKAEGITPLQRFGSHQVHYEFRQTVEWKTWTAQNGKVTAQADFAQFIEDNLPDITEPAGAALLQTCLTLEAHKSAHYSSTLRLDNGQVQFVYEEDIKGTAQKGALEIPQSFTLALKPFEGVEPYKVKARLRYRLKEGELSLWYDLERPHKIIEDAVKGIVAKIAGGVTNPITQGRLS
jgi:uncharacterized protein YfdQ (DUF2303 family)